MPESKSASIGGSFDDFLKAEGIYDACDLTAIRRVLSDQLKFSAM